MFTRKTIIALTALASLSSFALVSTEASAKMGGGFGGGMKFSGGGFKGGGGGAFKQPHNFKFKPHFTHHHHPHWRVGFRRHYWVAPVVTTAVATRYVAAPTWNKCSCLTKEYTPEGAVVFKDLCTKEIAMNPPATAPAPAAYDPNQAPQIQGSLQPQVQPQVYTQQVMPQAQQMAMPVQQQMVQQPIAQQAIPQTR